VTVEDGAVAKDVRAHRSTRRCPGGHDNAENSIIAAHHSSASAPSMPQAGSVAPAGLPPQMQPERRLPRLPICEGHEAEKPDGDTRPARFACLGEVAPYPAVEEASYVIESKPDRPGATSFERAFVDENSSGFMVVKAFPPPPQAAASADTSRLEMIHDRHQLKEAVDEIQDMASENWNSDDPGAAAISADIYDEQLRGSEEGGTSIPLDLFSDIVVKSGFCRSTDGAWTGAAAAKPDMKKGVSLTRSGLTYGVDMRHPTEKSELPETQILNPTS
jgi:hypothetical protein